jgi:ABC-type amino acid transport system permease subunit
LRIGHLRTVIRHVTFFSTMETLSRSIRDTSLHWGVVGGTLALILVPILLLGMLTAILRLVRRTLQKLITWRKLTTVSLVRRIPLLITLLIALLETSALASVASRYLSLKPLPFGIHLLALVVHHNSAIH